MTEMNCKNCKYHILRDSMRGKREGYCVLHKRWRGGTILCSSFDIADPVHVADVRFIPQTNADRIRAMTDEELAEWIYTHRWNDLDGLLDWLKQEVKGIRP